MKTDGIVIVRRARLPHDLGADRTVDPDRIGAWSDAEKGSADASGAGRIRNPKTNTQ